VSVLTLDQEVRLLIVGAATEKGDSLLWVEGRWQVECQLRISLHDWLYIV